MSATVYPEPRHAACGTCAYWTMLPEHISRGVCHWSLSLGQPFPPAFFTGDARPTVARDGVTTSVVSGCTAYKPRTARTEYPPC
jgi:hypothetical protein